MDRCVVFTRKLCHSFADTEFPRSPLVVDVVTARDSRHYFFIVRIYLCTSFRSTVAKMCFSYRDAWN